jgi:type III pantothenate kinase
MIIALDIGNTSINIGFFAASGLFVKRIPTHPLLSSSKYALLLQGFMEEKNMEKPPEGIIISSVVQGHTRVLMNSLKRLSSTKPLLVSSRLITGLVLALSRPEQLGSDRIANAVAAYELFKSAAAAVDFGTATTISVVDAEKKYIGGAILPGTHLMNESLARGTSRLHAVRIKLPVPALGRNTPGCIQSGLLYGTAGAVERILKEIEQEINCRLKVVVTGGAGALLSPFLKRKHRYAPFLTLEGLKVIYSRNRKCTN